MTRRKPIRIGTRMPGWVPVGLHGPVRVVLGLVLRAVLGLYCLGLALAVRAGLEGHVWGWGALGALVLAGWGVKRFAPR